MTPEESQRLLDMFGEGETITAAELASRMHGGKLKAYQKEPARKLAWHKIRKMEESGLVVKLQSRKGLPSTWAKVREGMKMRSVDEIEIREKLADLHFDIDAMSRKQLYEAHRTQRQVNIAIIGMFALITVAFIIGVAVGGSL